MAHEPHASPLAVAYARSVLELANERSKPREIGQELQDISGIVDADPALANFLANPAVGETEREAVIRKAFTDRVDPLILNFLMVVNRKGRLSILGQIAAAYEDLLEQQMGIVEVDVIVARRLSSEQLDDVRQQVGRMLKREAVVHQYVDESIIGGLVLRIEDRVLDASVRAQLGAIRRRLLSARGK